ncbi:hypothetical protein [Streptomyces sp. NPDC004376]
MAWILTATSRTGQPVNPFTKEPTDSVAVYTKADLDRRIKAAESDPRDIEISIRNLDD